MVKRELTQEEREIIKRLEEHRDTSGFSNAQLARKIGIGAATLSELFSGKYEGAGTLVLPKIRRWLNFQERGGVEFLEGDTVETAVYKGVQTVCRYAHKRGRGGLIIGGAGVGKTTALKKYCAESPNAHYIGLGPTHTGKGFLTREIAYRLGVPSRDRITTVQKDLLDELRDASAFIVFDDAHFLGPMSIALIQYIHDQTRCGFVLAGVPMLHTQMVQSKDTEWFAQIRSRCGIIRRFDASEVTHEEAVDVARAILKGRDLAPDAANLLAEVARAQGGYRSVEMAASLALELVKDGPITKGLIEKALAYRRGL